MVPVISVTDSRSDALRQASEIQKHVNENVLRDSTEVLGQSVRKADNKSDVERSELLA